MKVEGIVVPLITPFDENGLVDAAGLRNLVEWLIGGRIDGLFVAGTTGEFARLDEHERHRLFDLCVEFVGDRATVYAGVTDSHIEGVIRHVRAAERAGVDAVVAGLPYYFPLTEEQEIERWFGRILEVSSLPLLMYDIPGNVQASIPAQVVHTFADAIAGLKDSSGSVRQMQAYIEALGGDARETGYLVGDESLLIEAFESRADGLVPSMANVFPALWSSLWSVRDEEEAYVSHLGLISKVGALNRAYPSSMGHVAWKKRILHLNGVCSDKVAFPSEPIEHDDQRLRSIFDQVMSTCQSLGDLKETTG